MRYHTFVFFSSLLTSVVVAKTSSVELPFPPDNAPKQLACASRFYPLEITIFGTPFYREGKKWICDTCPNGQRSDPNYLDHCSRCKAGSFSNAQFPTCTNCTAGTFSLDSSNTCTACKPGTFSSTAGSSSCTPCDEGSFSLKILSSCQSCLIKGVVKECDKKTGNPTVCESGLLLVKKQQCIPSGIIKIVK